MASIASPDGALLGTSAGELAPDRLGGGSGQGAAAAAAAAAAVGATASPSTFDDDDEEVQTVTNLAPDAQTITTACWLTMKEVSLLIGELSRAVPGDDETLLEPTSLKACGEHLLHVLLSMKHNGAIEKTRVGLVCLGERLLQSSNPALSSLPATWLESLFKKLTSPEQGIKDLIRRSAGLPFGFTAVFLAEPAGVPRKLLHGAMARLLDIAVRMGNWTDDPRWNPPKAPLIRTRTLAFALFVFHVAAVGEFAAMNAINSLTDSLPNELSGNLGNICSLNTTMSRVTDAPGRRLNTRTRPLSFSLSLSLFLSILWNTRLEHAAAKTKPRLPLLTKQ